MTKWPYPSWSAMSGYGSGSGWQAGSDWQAGSMSLEGSVRTGSLVLVLWANPCTVLGGQSRAGQIEVSLNEDIKSKEGR
jgi:hypothetical protein